MNQLHAMRDYNYWANTRTLATIEAAENAEPKILELFSHIMNAELVWMARMKQSESLPPWQLHTLEECRNLMEKNNDEYTEFLAWLRPDELKRELTFTDSRGGTHSMVMRDIFTHVFNHGTYHRGQIALLLRRGGDEPVGTDYMLYARTAPKAG
ncbi:MAG: DinB family protein [Candidatus Kapabacteria bacterium]|nr:DinB family protein [Candidatus Kapabacteria bacterium]